MTIVNEKSEYAHRWVCPIPGCGEVGSLAPNPANAASGFLTHLEGHERELFVAYLQKTSNWCKSFRIVEEAEPIPTLSDLTSGPVSATLSETRGKE